MTNKKQVELSLRDDSTKELVVQMHESGVSGRKIGKTLGISPRAIQEFLTKDTWKEWWEIWTSIDVPISDENWLKSKIPYNSTDERVVPSDINKTYNPKNLKVYVGGVELKSNHFLDVINSPKPSTKKILVIGDTQCKPSESLEYMTWIGKYIRDKKPDIVVHIGDHFDFESLSSYDKGKKSFEGRRLLADIEAGKKGLELLTSEFLSEDYTPEMYYCLGNHEDRFDRLSRDMPELDGFVGVSTLNIEDFGFEVIPFLKPIEIEGIYFVHYLANPMTGRPFTGTALNQLKTVGRSFVAGHKQVLDIAIRPTLDGKHQIGIINGACYPFEEDYKGYQGNNHFRGLTVLHEVEDGFGLPSFVSMNYLEKKYGNE